jgi:4-amino-4-deoxy-L-arabinose transferase-like glycosyltransferase
MEATRGIDTLRQTWGLLLALIAAMTAWRLGVATILPVTQDEAYYFDWARSLAWGYFDHPPGVALLGIGTWLAPGSALAARSGTLIASALTLLVLARFFLNCGLTAPRDLALSLVLVVATIPGFAGGVITTPDTVLGLAWALALHESERALAGQRRRWLTAGAAVGLGLLGKYTMVLIGPVLLLAIVFSDPRALRTRWPYLGGLVALLVFAPNILWNQQNDWLTMRFQFGHGFSTDVGALPVGAPAIEHVGPRSIGERLGSLSGYLGTQLAFWGLIAIPLLVAPWINRRQGAKPNHETTGALRRHAKPLLWAATLFPLGFFALVATGSEVEPNWPAVYLMSAAPLAALLLRHLRPWAVVAALGNLLLLTLYAFHAATAALPLGDSQNRVLRETHGFRALAEIAGTLEEPVYADRYQTTAMLRFYAPSLDTTTQWPSLTRPSEYLRGQIAPRLDSESVDAPFWLVSGFGAPPDIAGFRSDTHRRLFDCAGQPLSETAQAPCSRPLHTWNLYRYLPEG